ncbi:DNA-binding response regulator [Algibacter lectus]|uniref:DNA-binding response regulator n=1 Tax=Algibacter lectus TaxID=221126 RepID=A0A090WYK1_9FLAO|nr:two-component regulator propeller domain-containing protein [Algibacter lectus]GAL82031.1 DNA-binding response regulator [Algibacter lectus]
MKIICNILFIYLSFGSFKAQSVDNYINDLKFKHFTSKDGLSQRSITDILQDKKGYLWIGTRDGLNKFDGNNFIVYRYSSEDYKSLSNSWVTKIYEDELGNIWIGTKDGLNKFNESSNSFIRFEHPASEKNISSNEIFDLTQTKANFLWAIINGKIALINTKSNQLEKSVEHEKIASRLQNQRVRSFFVSDDDMLWINTVEGIEVYDPEKETFKHYNYPSSTPTVKNFSNLSTLFLDRDDNLWLGGYENGLAKYNKALDKFIDYKFKGSRYITSSVRSICQDHEGGNLWIGAYSGLYMLDLPNAISRHYINNENNPTGLSQNSIYKIVLDSRGDIWIGTWAGGLNYFNKNYDTFKHFLVGNNETMLNYKVVSSIVEDSQKNLWIAPKEEVLIITIRKQESLNISDTMLVNLTR